MKHLYDFKSYLLLEAFDLNKMYQKQNIIPQIQHLAKTIVSNKFDVATEVPNDMLKNRDKVELWLAKNIKNICLEIAIYYHDIEYKSYQLNRDGIYRHVEEAAYIVDALKGKNTDKYTFKEVIDELYSGDLSVVPDIKNDKLEEFINYSFVDKHLYELNGIFDYFLSPIRNQNDAINLVTSTIGEMNVIQLNWHESLKASGKIYNQTGNILKTYPDGFYWIDLLTNKAVDEAKAMGHCGNTNADTLISLRKKSDGGYIIPYVTIAIDYQQNGRLRTKEATNKYLAIHQIKGKNNKKPLTKYHPYIVDLLTDTKLDIQVVENDEYSPQDDFHITDLEKKEDIDRLLHLFETEHDTILLYKKGYITAADAANRLQSDGFVFKNGKIYIIADELEEFMNLFYSRRQFSRIINALNNNHGFYNDSLKFEIEWQNNMLSTDEVDIILDKIDISELDDLGENELKRLTDADIDLNNIINDIRTNDTKDKVKLQALLSLTDMLSVDAIVEQLHEAYRLAKNESDRQSAKEYLIKVISEALQTEIIVVKSNTDDNDIYEVEIPEHLYDYINLDSMINKNRDTIEINLDKLYSGEYVIENFRTFFATLVKQNID
jgi:hypothetical protein